MSEMPVELEGQPLPEGNADPEAVLEVENTEEATNSETEQPEASEPQKPKGVQKRIDELTANWREEQRTRQKLEAMLEKVLNQAPKPEAPPPQPVKTEPTLEQFKTYEEYVDARAEWVAERKFTQIEQERRAAEAEQAKATKHDTFLAKAKEFSATAPDFDDVAFNPSLPVTDVMADAIDLSDKGPEILYFLGKNPGEAERIARMPGLQAALEIGRLEGRLSLPQPKTVTNAPPPIRPISGGHGAVVVDPDKMTSGEWLAWRNEQIRKK